MNQHDEQNGALSGAESSPSGTAADTWVDEEPSGMGQDDGTDHAATAVPAKEDAPEDLTEQATATSAGDGAPGGTEPSAYASTGYDRVDEALSRLTELDRLDVTEHAGVVEDVHRALQDTLAEEED